MIYRYWYTDFLVEVKFDSVSEHLPDDPDKFAGAVPESIVMRPAFRHLFIIISFEGGVVLNNIVCCVNECVSEHSGAMFGHSGVLGTVITGLVNRRV